tara:strand:+ start:1053 stop:1313 length:261 start_codon:yes stop_codon:yes gene_type:complete
MSVSEYLAAKAKAAKQATKDDNETVEKVHSMSDKEKAAALKKKKGTKKNINDAMKKRAREAKEEASPEMRPKTLGPGDFPPLDTSA